MTREYMANFATSALVSPNPLTSSGMSFTVTAGQGALFPSSNFLVTIDSEILLIASVSGDTFTVGARGYDNTVAANHSVGATVQLSSTAQHFNHLWQNTPDTYTPSVPPANQMAGLSPSSWDIEFENAGSWSYYPTSAGSGSTWDIGNLVRSHLLLNRGSTDNTIYTAYTNFSPTGSYMVTMRISLAAAFNQTVNTNNQLQAYFFITDQTNPTVSANGGNGFCIKAFLADNVNTSGASYYANEYLYQYAVQVEAQYSSSGSSTSLTPVITPCVGQTLFLRISYSGSGTYNAYIGDGIVYSTISAKGGLGFTPQTMGVQFQTYISSGSGYPGTMAVDYIRTVVGSQNPRYGY